MTAAWSLVVSVAIALHLQGCEPKQSSTSPGTAAELVGYWYGDDYQPVMGQNSKWLMHRRDDGTFTVQFHTAGPGPKRTMQVEHGAWKREGSRYSTRTFKINDELMDQDDPQYYDEYELKEVSPNSITYRHVSMRVTFRSKRVSSDYKVP